MIKRMNYPHLLAPIKVGEHVLKNRTVYPNASPHFLQGPETYPAEGYRAFNANLAKNGAAIVTIAEWANYPAQRIGPADMDMTHMQAFDMTDPAVHNYISQMAEEVHFYGSKILVSTSLMYPDGYSLNGGKSRGPGGGKETQPIPADMIPQAVEDFVKKMRLYKNLGYDGLSMRCDMGLVPAANERADKYGGSLENRTRFMRECFAAVKKAFGGKFLIEGVIAWEQPDGYGGTNPIGSGYFENESLEFCNLCEGLVDIMQVRESNGCVSHPTGYNFKKGVHPAVEFCARAKAAGVNILLEPIGGFQEPDEMDRYIAEGKCDMFGISRAFMADSEYGLKMYAGQGEDITPCLKCNKCHGTILPDPEPWTSICSVNPKQGLGHKIDRMTGPVQSVKKVAVIGGGPAGIRAALFASERGHKVTLYEKSGELGGQLFHGDYLPFKWPIGNYKRWLIEQLGKSDVEVVMNTAPTKDMIKSGGYDAVLAATGAQISLPDGIKGLKDDSGNLSEGLWTCLGTYGKADQLGKKVVIIGGSEVGIETAMYLCGEGHDVTVLTRQGRIAHNASRLHYITAAFVKHGEDDLAYESPAWEMYDNLDYVVNATTTEVRVNEVVYTDQEGKQHTISADSIVICGGMTPCTDQAMEYAGLTQEFYTIGDCNGAGNLEICNREAFSRAMIL